jgi:hypothetical protein
MPRGRAGWKTQYSKQHIIENYFQYLMRRSITTLGGYEMPCMTLEDFVAIHYRGRKSPSAYEKILDELGIDYKSLMNYNTSH